MKNTPINKYEIGDIVYAIDHGEIHSTTQCKTCSSSGIVVIAGETFTCPKCHGTKENVYSIPPKWFVDTQSMIGQITIVITHGDLASKKGVPEINVTYMLYSTGIFSGRVWKEKDLFLNKDEAEKECARRTNERIQWTNQ